MKNTIFNIFILSILILGIKTTSGQPVPGENCISAAPFCTGLVYDFPMNINTQGEQGPNYGCLYTFPNPVWYYLKIDNPGNITIKIVGSSGTIGRDVDFICWGPFNSLDNICTDSLYGACAWRQCPNNTSNPGFYPGQSAPKIIDCSYDPAPFENCRITNAQHGKYYMLCITNYSNQPGNLKFSKESGTATTDCSIVLNRAKFDVPDACEGVAVHFADSSTVLHPITSRLWDFGDGHTDTAANPDHIYAAAGKYIVRLTITIEGDTYSVAHYVVVNKLITNISPPSPINICKGDSVNLIGIVTTYPQTYIKSSFVRTINEPIPDKGVDSLYWVGEYPPDPGLFSLYVADTIYVTGINPGWNINNISLNIEHTFDNDVLVYVKAPGNVRFVQLIKNCGGAENDFIKTSFVPPPLATINIKNGVAPFSGGWIPSGGESIWSTLTGFVNPNGPWILTVADASDTENGIIKDWSIEFDNPKQTKFNFKWLNPINDSLRLSHIVYPTDTTTYTFTAENEFGCISTSLATVNVVPDPVIVICNDTTICTGDSATLFASGALNYIWMPGNLTGSIVKVAPRDTITYYLTGFNQYGCSSTKSVVVNVTDGPDVKIIRDTTIYVNTSLTLTASGAHTYLWMPENKTGPSITVSPIIQTDYYLYGTDIRGCTTIDTITVRIDYSTNIFIPNTFSPNGDDQNDVLYVRGYGLKEIEFSIFDRWGEKVFYSNSQDLGWNGTYKGKMLTPAVYAYFLKAITFDNKIIEKKGNITLIK